MLEPRVWLAIPLYIGIHDLPVLRNGCNDDGMNPTCPTCDYTGLTQFEGITRYLNVFFPDLLSIAPIQLRLCHSNNAVSFKHLQIWLP